MGRYDGDVRNKHGCIKLRMEISPPDPRFGVWLVVLDREHRLLGMDTSFDGTPTEIEDYWIGVASSLDLELIMDEATRAALTDIRDGDDKWGNYVKWWRKQYLERENAVSPE